MSIKNTVIIRNQMEELIHEQTLAGSPVQSSIEWIFRTSNTLGSVLCKVYNVDSKELNLCKNLQEIVHSEKAIAFVAEHSGLWKLFMGSPTAIEAMARSAPAMDIILSSESAWKSFAANTTAITYVIEDEELFQIVLDTDDYWQVFMSTSTAMNVVRNNAEALETIINSEKHMLDIISNTTAFNTLITSELFVEALFSNNRYWKEVLSVQTAITKMIGTTAVFKRILDSDIHWKDFFSTKNAIEYAVKDKTAFTAIINSDKKRFQNIVDSKDVMTVVCANSVSRTALYDNYKVTESILGRSIVAIDCMKKSANYRTVSGTPTQSHGISTTLYNGKAFVIRLRGSRSLNYDDYRINHGNYLVYSNGYREDRMEITEREVMHFASSVGNSIWPSAGGYTLSHDIFTI